MTIFHTGPVMWRCRNGAPNYRRVWWAKISAYTHCTLHSLPIYPVVTFTPWHKGCLSNVEELGQFSHSFTIGVEFWKWTVYLIVGRTQNIKTQEHIS